MSDKKFLNLGVFLQSKPKEGTDEKEYYIKIDKDVTLAFNEEEYEGKYLKVRDNDSSLDYIRFDVLAGDLKVGSIFKSKTGNGYYLSKDRKVSLHINGTRFDGEYINMKKPQEKYDTFLEKGIITQEEYDTKITNLPEYIKYELVVLL